MRIAVEILLILLAYLLGSIPFGYFLTKKFTGMNIRELGSGNIGSTNVRRFAGARIALLTQLCDMLKGLLPVAIVLELQYLQLVTFDVYIIYTVAMATILGHNFSAFLRFKGGKGVNTTLGASVLLSPVPVFLSVFIYFIIKKWSKYVSLGSISLALVLPVSELAIYGVTPLFYYLLLCFALILAKHASNIVRLMDGTEPRSIN
jgi:glycerol-3-phosphate acyltransferase PlsY